MDDVPKIYITDYIQEWNYIVMKEGNTYFKAFVRSDDKSPFKPVLTKIAVQSIPKATLVSINYLKSIGCIFEDQTTTQTTSDHTQLTNTSPSTTPTPQTIQLLDKEFSMYDGQLQTANTIICRQTDFREYIVNNTTLPVFYRKDDKMYVFRNNVNKPYPYVIFDDNNKIEFKSPVKRTFEDAKFMYNKYTPEYRPIAEILESERV